ncbi:MAG TPA: sigma-54 dependent transcriptional regulator [Aliidongia sp.]|uniref:sigma-54-dependent transcriptional regulator FlbD n=1 Tax=Aliidongia sp. TaxID=1914230 RepID=UPI002DDCAB00|nr:sigma-54 dependent transcriptional regulator [Aliidongia sp.]HEV2674056.1 sigma-54 dependent transcriptional regulator [Aliidongia sp.]
MRLLIVGPLSGYISAAGKIALSRGAKVAQIDDIDKAMAALRAGQGADLVMIDVKLDVGRMVQSLKAERIHIQVVACGVGTDAESAVRAIKAGAKEYIPLPPDAQLIASVLEAVAAESHQLVFRDPVMGQVLRLADQIAPSDASVLITGESGTGKEIMARHLHRKSRRAEKPFISINCAAIPEQLLESELFGHEKGAFTGAVARRLGKFEEAHGGTLLLDEVTEMHPRLQAKLLRAIQEREIDRVGGSQPVKIDIRVIATSNRDMEEAVRQGQFRDDLYFRLNVVTLRLPALRERPADVAALAEHFAKKYSELNDVDYHGLSDAARAMLVRHHWRGNVRELENTIHRAVLLSNGGQIDTDAIMLTGMRLGPEPAAPQNSGFVIAPAHPPRPAGAGASAMPPGAGGGAPVGTLVGRTVADVERDLIIETLQHCLGNRTHAAGILGISIRTLRNKLQQYKQEGLSVPLPGDVEARA